MFALQFQFDYDGQMIFASSYLAAELTNRLQGFVWQINQAASLIQQNYDQEKAKSYLKAKIAEDIARHNEANKRYISCNKEMALTGLHESDVELSSFADYCFLNLEANDDPLIKEIASDVLQV